MNTKNISLAKRIRLAIKYPAFSFSIFMNIMRNNFLRGSIPNFPRLITLYATNRCNLSCSMCVNGAYRRNATQVDDLGFKTIEKILPELIKYKPMIYITGGEPLLNEEIFEIIKILTKNKIVTGMATNGVLLEENINRIIESGLEFITISLDHYKEEEHDRARGLNGTYTIVMRGLHKLLTARKTSPSHIKINTVIRNNNYKCLSRMYDFIESLGIEEWSLQHYSFLTPQAVRSISDAGTYELTDFVDGNIIENNVYLDYTMVAELGRQLKEIAEKGKKYKTKFYVTPKVDNLFSYYQGEWPSKGSRCTAPFECLNILPNLEVTLCRGFNVGNLSVDNFLINIWRSQKTKEFQELFNKKNILAVCYRCCALNYKFSGHN